MKRELIEALTGREISDAEWDTALSVLKSIESHPDAEAVLDRCIEQGLSVEETINELAKLPRLVESECSP
jgi:hypothetical protein